MDNKELKEKELATVSGGVDANRRATVEEVIERINNNYPDVKSGFRNQIIAALKSGGFNRAYKVGMDISLPYTPERAMVIKEIAPNKEY